MNSLSWQLYAIDVLSAVNSFGVAGIVVCVISCAVLGILVLSSGDCKTEAAKEELVKTKRHFSKIAVFNGLVIVFTVLVPEKKNHVYDFGFRGFRSRGDDRWWQGNS